MLKDAVSAQKLMIIRCAQDKSILGDLLNDASDTIINSQDMRNRFGL